MGQLPGPAASLRPETARTCVPHHRSSPASRTRIVAKGRSDCRASRAAPPPEKPSEMSDLAQFEGLIGNLMQPDNNIRGQAESYFTQLKLHEPEKAVLSLLSCARNSTSLEVSKREFSEDFLTHAFRGPRDV